MQFITQIYMTLCDSYGGEILVDYYDRIIDSISKKTVGVSEVLGHLCKVLTP